ncbi:flavin reductase family protein [Rhizomonospora bruguierae]|uniref:flavin reductase family protein n=1 Tax=Rhizomonospora bruguierae TaxID=1581705 RepID=UPI001BCB00E6|nr:flavin reductase family protein [Micromonospora sp. NBRC 107566]
MHVRSNLAIANDPLLLRRTLGLFATGVTVVTVAGTEPHGMTANSFTAVSLDPPLILVCVRRDTVMHDRLLSADAFGISVLAAHQEAVARHFANPRRPLGHRQFDPVDWFPGGFGGAPLLADAAALLECELWRTYDGGDHSIVVGRLVRFDREPDAEVLLFLNGRFRQLDREAAVDLTT